MVGSPSAIITLGLGSWGSPGLIVTLGYGIPSISTLIGQWSNVIDCHGNDSRIEARGNLRRIEVHGNSERIEV